MKKQQIALLVIMIIIILASLIYYQINDKDNQLVGGNKDEHGCIVSAGYSWCEAKQECLRIWEEACNPEDCKDYEIDRCPAGCAVCPTCKVCSSISCNSKEFCESIGFNETWYKDMNQTKHYCVQEERINRQCPQFYSKTCGWFKSNIPCSEFPCAVIYANPCFACLDPKIDYYTEGECPK